MEDILSEDDINQLINKINNGDKPDYYSRKMKIYDFKRPDKFSKEQIRSMSIIHETFARLTSVVFSSLCRCPAHIHVASVDQLTYEEFIRSIPTPTTLGIIDMSSVIGNTVIEIDPAITFAILNFILGGTDDDNQQHELTDTEKSIMEEVFNRSLEKLKEAWEKITESKPVLKTIETNPQFVQIVYPTEMVVLITIEAKINDTEGMINLCYPYPAIEPIIEKLSMNYMLSPREPEIFNIDTDDIEVPLRAEIFKTTITYGELKKIKSGSILNCKPNKIIKANDIVIGEWTDFTDGNKSDCANYNKVLLTSINTRKEIDYMNEKNNINAKEEVLRPELLDEIEMQIICELGRTKATMKEIKSFREGTTLEFDTYAGEPVNIFANNKLIAKGEVVVIDEHFGVRFLECVNP